jgi:prevent-host-death family protein
MPMVLVPLYEAKNHLSELVARVERGEEIAISRRGVPVARLVAIRPSSDADDQCAQVAGAFECLRQLRADLVLEGDLKALAREGLA